jgi:PBP1b-binding outer membrane lipoprotein LpoB
MKIETLLLILFMSAILLMGCAQQQPPSQSNTSTPGPTPQQPPQNQTPTPQLNQTPAPQNQTPPSPPPEQPITIDMSTIFQYGAVHSYTYQTLAAGMTINETTSISSDTVNGTAAWLQQTDVTTQGATVTSKMWVDKVTFKCLEVTTVMNYGGQAINQTVPCPTEGPNSDTRTGTNTPQLTYTGTESITVPAGTFSCKKYSLEGMTFWVASGVPVPVKVAFGTSTMELVSYT